MARKMDQFRDGSLGRKLLPNPRYFHMGFGGLSGLESLGSILGAVVAGCGCVSTYFYTGDLCNEYLCWSGWRFRVCHDAEQI